jgi:hypothetical protein
MAIRFDSLPQRRDIIDRRAVAERLAALPGAPEEATALRRLAVPLLPRRPRRRPRRGRPPAPGQPQSRPRARRRPTPISPISCCRLVYDFHRPPPVPEQQPLVRRTPDPDRGRRLWPRRDGAPFRR